MLKRPAIPDMLKKIKRTTGDAYYEKTKQNSGHRGLPFHSLQYTVLSSGFIRVHRVSPPQHHFSHCCKHTPIPWPLFPPLHITGINPTLGSCVSLGKSPMTSWLFSLQSQTSVSTEYCIFHALTRQLLSSHPFTPSSPCALSASKSSSHITEIRTHYVISYLSPTQPEPGTHLYLPSPVSTEKVHLPSHCLISPFVPWILSLWLINDLVLFVNPSSCISNFFLSARSFSWAWKHALPSLIFQKEHPWTAHGPPGSLLQSTLAVSPPLPCC